MTVPIATILSEGETMDARYELLSVDIDRELNRIPGARLVLLDGDAPQRTFAISETGFFEPGKQIEIKLRYEGEEEVTVFRGPVVTHGIESGTDGSRLTLELKDAAIKLAQSRKGSVFRDQSDGEIIGALVQDAGLEAGEIAATEPQHAEIVQYHASDWDFILSRADIQGLVVLVDDGTISVRKMELSGSPEHSFEHGLSEIFDFELEADATHQRTGFRSVGWDIREQTLTEPSEAEDVATSPGDLDGGGIAETVGFPISTLAHPVPTAPEELQAWADARMARSRLSMIRGRIAVPGRSDIKPMDVVDLGGFGARFNGTALVTGVHHQLDHDGWKTDLQLGLSPEWFCHREGIAESPAAGLLPPVSGLQIGIVDSFEADPDNELRVKVNLPSVTEEGGAVWARLASPDAGPERGYFFRPEPGDEVVLGFFNNDPRQPVILGAMYSSANPPPAAVGEPTEENTQKAIVTKKGTTIGFLDEDMASVFIETAEQNKILIDDNAQSIEITDQHGNSITMNSSGIELKSASDLKIDASGNVEIKGAAIDLK